MEQIRVHFGQGTGENLEKVHNFQLTTFETSLKSIRFDLIPESTDRYPLRDQAFTNRSRITRY
jgi:hypothetical protein